MWANALGALLFLVLSLMGHAALIKLPGLYLMSPYCRMCLAWPPQ